jgi:hypothetical protein
MKGLIFLAFLILFSLKSVSQTVEDTLLARLGLKGLQIPADQVFLHTDRNIYYPGDTIYFHAFIRDRQTGIFETGSISLYAMLVSDNHKTIDSARFRIANSTASGWLKVPEAVSAGNCSLISFTSKMMNYGTEFIFSAPVRIDKKRVFRSLTAKSRDEKDTIEFLMDTEPRTIDLRFLPEGGTFVYGIRQRMAFNAVTSTGSNIRCKGHLINNKGELITDFSSGMFSPGVIEFTPLSGDTYFAVPDNEEFAGMKWPLPLPENSGVTLSTNTGANDEIEVKVEGKGVTGNHYIVTLVMNNVLVLSQEFKIDSLWRMKINTSELPAGTAYITLFNNELSPVAERLVFLNPDKKLNIEIKPSAVSYGRGEETTLTINITDYNGNNVSSVVSVSAADSTYGYYDAFPFFNIESIFLFDNMFWNNLPGKIRQHGLFNIDEENLDLLLMTYGWRKYKKKVLTGIISDYISNDYDYMVIKNPGPEKKTRPEIIFTTLEGGEVISIKKERNGDVILPFDTLDNQVRQLMILPDKNLSKNVYPVKAEFPFNKEFIKEAKSARPEFIIPEEEFSFNRDEEKVITIDSAIQIEAVTIRAPIKPVEVFVNKYQEFYQYASLSTISKKEMKGCLNLEDILARLHPYFLDTKDKKIYLRPAQNLKGYSPPSLIVIDDIPLWEMSYASITDMPASQISSVTALKGKQGFAVYGEAAFGGVVFITTSWKKMAEGDLSEEDLTPVRPRDDLMKPINIFRTEVEFYIPTKEEVALIPEYQVRPTLYWNDEILLDGNGPVTITFPNHMLNSKVIVIANGVSLTNMPGAARITYMIK